MRIFTEPLRIFYTISLILFLVIACIQPNQALASSQPYILSHQVNFGTGNKYLSATDISLSGPGAPLVFSRTYNNQSAVNSVLGYGWTGTFMERLVLGTSIISQVQESGRYIDFASDGTDKWTVQNGVKSSITKNTSGYQLKEPLGTIRQYDTTGMLLSVTDRNNNTRSYTYAGGLVASINDNFGHSLSFTYTNGKLTGVTSALGTWTYSYQNDNLVNVTKPDGTTLQYIYDSPSNAHNLSGIIDESGTRILTVVYDSQNRVINSTKTNGSEAVTIAYPYNFMRTVTNSLGVKTTYQLDVLNGVVKVGSMTGPGCSGSCGGTANTKYIYDARFQITQATDANGTKTAYTYDAVGNEISVTRAVDTPLANTITKTYDPITNQILTITKPSVATPGQQTVTTMTCDSHGNLISKQQDGYSGTTAISRTTQYTYNTYGQITSIDGPRTDVNDAATFSYYANDASQGNNRGNLQTVTDALGHTTTYSDYTAFGQAQTITDPNGIVTTRVYNGNGLLLAATTSGLTTSYTYDTTGRLLTLTLPGNRMISYSYAPAGQVAKITDSLGNAISYTYDSEGRRTGEQIQDPQNALTRSVGYAYDDYGHLNKITLPGNVQETAGYDLVGNLVSTINATAMETDYQYDALNRLLSVTEAGQAVTGSTYDAHGNIVTVTDANNNATNFTTDDFDRKIIRTAPDTGQNVYSYDQAGNLVTITDAKGQNTSFGYDALNRLIGQSYEGTGDILFTYDQGTNALGHLSQITDREGTDSFAYDSNGRIATETRVIGNTSHTIGYSWDPVTGDLAGMTYPSGLSLTYSRDTNGQVNAITTSNTTLVSAVAHLPFGPLKSAALGSVNLTKEYDQRYNVTRISAGSLDYAYTRDAGGHVTGITGIQSPTVVNESTTYYFNAANNQLTSSTSAPPNAYTYDANGNMVSDGVFTFVYDGLNRLISVTQQGCTVATYGYDSSNRRVRKTVGSTITHYLYDLNNRLIAETLADGAPLREYIYLDGEPIVLKEYQTNPGLYYYINDLLGAPQQLVTDTGTVAWQAAYLPYGLAQITTETVKNNLRFPGQYFDAETGLHYNLNRYYDSDTGRYTSPDPVGLEGGMNLYAYALNNPVNLIDPWGLATLVIINGPTSGNPFGHTAIATTGSGVYSPGNNPNATSLNFAGSSVTDYLADQAKRRESVLFILPTTTNQEEAILNYIREKTTKPDKFPDNCVGRVENALNAGGVNLTDPFIPGVSLPASPFPSALLRALQNLESQGGATSVAIPRNGSMPSALNTFNP